MDNADSIIYPKYKQLYRFASELLLILLAGKDVPINIICEQIGAGTIVEYVFNKFGFKNMNDSLEMFCDINTIMQNHHVSEIEAQNRALESSGIGYLIQLILEDLDLIMFSLSENRINPDFYLQVI